ncbi:uncharacterized protein LOC102701660 isoform X1 [Oryza brachyantha]|uniref:uncharacterized protein LOC102701660 isoform X1 n=1 Tax=Oryza brachyantha TaxID=4533 RepID=UPI001ADB91E3|nr:uncharacterized protein LOC102701660 isoform X1 [Oryza brachyantha]
MVTLSSSAPPPPVPPIRSVNLGGWLVTEGWMLPSLFDGIPNNDLLDGTQLQFKSAVHNTYLTAEHGGGGSAVAANRATASDWETFRLWRIDENTFNLKAFDDDDDAAVRFVGVDGNGELVATAAVPPGPSETFKIVRSYRDKSRVRIRAPNGKFLQAKTMDSVTADHDESTTWGDDDPSVFVMNKVYALQGEYQLCNGYGRERATEVLREHWSTYIVESDFKFISSNGLNAVRIPVGWWIASDPNPPAPFVGGSLEALDSAFIWAEKYNLGVIVDLHAAPGSQNSGEHSGSRDGSQAWGTTDESITQTVQVIDFLASRYANSPSLLAVELLNEPWGTKISAITLKKYYQDGYNAVRRHTSNAYVIMCNPLAVDFSTQFEILQFASEFYGVVFDIHYYNMYSSIFDDKTAEWNIQYVTNDRSTELSTFTKKNGPLTYVGEWSAEWNVLGASEEDYKRFAQAQLEVYSQATFGWAFWSFKHVQNHWSLEWMIKNGYISLNPPKLPIRAVNLGGWLVTEGWIQPSLFDGISNKDLLDGTQLQFKSVTNNMYLAAEQGGGSAIVANRDKAFGWETFKLWRINETIFNFRVYNNLFVSIDGNGTVIATATVAGPNETFQIMRSGSDTNRVRIRASNGKFLQVKAMDSVIADHGDSTNWGNDDPSVFLVNNIYGLQGEYQICNGYGAAKATQVLREHWSTFIVENDFRFISSNGLNAVRIPVGWWIASDPDPPAPFVGGSLQALDNAFKWAEKYNIGIIVGLHAAPGSQNGWEHGATRDGSLEWGTTAANITQTVEVIDFLASRYAKRASLLAIELLNEPLAPKVSLATLTKYYQEAYNVVRKYTLQAYVILQNRAYGDSMEILSFANSLFGAVIDVHYYNLYDSIFDNFTVEQNINFVRNNRSSELSTVTKQNGPLTFVGEWVAEWYVDNASKEDYQRFAQVQLDLYGGASFGWSYWSFKHVENHWSMEWMIKNGFISLEKLPPSTPPIRSVNLGGWLVTEGWMLPSLFDGIPNNDLLDGTVLHFKSVIQDKFIAAEEGGGSTIVANRAVASDWESFTLWRINETTFNLRVFKKYFVGINSNGIVKAMATAPGRSEAFHIVRSDIDKNRVRIRASNGCFLQAKTIDSVTADYGESTNWGNDDPSVFIIDNISRLQGEYQICNGYGAEKASQVLREHWSTYIVESDFKFISSSGLNAVRIPVGWWIASDPNPPAPFVGGSLQALDNAFKWAEKYNIGVIVDLHAAPGSQNYWAHSATRDGSVEWGTTDATVTQTVKIIDFLTSRYANSPSLLAVELLNEPWGPDIPLKTLMKYYEDAYNAVRKYTAKAYVIMSNRAAGESTELLDFASRLPGTVIDVHYYNLFNDTFRTFNVEQNIEFVKKNLKSELSSITRKNSPLSFVGEWAAVWKAHSASKEDYQRFVQAQLDVYGGATFGWAYWTMRAVQNHWSMEWMINNRYISLKK